MRISVFPAAILLGMTLTACGSSEPEKVVEQIVIREPEEPAANTTMKQAINAVGATDLVVMGEEAFQVCAGCHNANKGGRSMAGPNLYGVVGRKAGSLEGYYYSEALSRADITWNYATLDRFLANPAGYVEGTSMVAGAVRDGEQRAAIVAYLASTSE